MQNSAARFDSPEATTAFAQTLSSRLSPGDVILLEGDLGAGKTHFARSLIQALLLAPEDVPSPTFTLVQTYQGRVSEIWHADLYRLTSEWEAEELGLEDAFQSAICVVEWPDRLGVLRPANALTLRLEMDDHIHARRASFRYTDAKWKKILPNG